MSDIGSEVRREVNAGIATVSRMMERLETRSNGRPNNDSVPDSPDSAPVVDLAGQHEADSVVEPGVNNMRESNVGAQCPAASASD